MAILFPKIYGQNLLFNNGFDEHFDCPSACNPNNFAKLSNNIFYWKGTYNWAGYFHFCGDTCYYPTASKVPNNFMGFQYPRSDSGYIALYAGVGFTTPGYRGFAFQKMKQNLQVGKKYWVEYNASLGDSANYAVRALGATFCMDTLNIDQPIAFNEFNRPFKMENSGDFVSDKIRWTPIHWIFEADSAYQTFLMGYARSVGQYGGDTINVGSSCFWCEQTSALNIWCFYYFDDAGVFPIISNNQQIKACSFPKVLQGPTESGITFREWKKDTVVLPPGINQTINQAGTYTLTWRTDTTVHIDTFFVEADIPIDNFLGLDVAWQTGQQVVLAAPMGYSYLWSTTETSQTITCDTAGIYSVIVTNAFNCSYSDAVEVYDITAVKDLEEDWGVEVYPNPAGVLVTIKVNEVFGGGTPTTGVKVKDVVGGGTPTTGGNTNKGSDLEIHNTSGQLLLKEVFTKQTIINVNAFPPGVYFLKISNGVNVPILRKLVVNR